MRTLFPPENPPAITRVDLLQVIKEAQAAETDPAKAAALFSIGLHIARARQAALQPERRERRAAR